MGKVTVQAQVIARYSVDRDKTQPDDLAAEVKRKVEAALDEQGAEVEVVVKARDG